MKIRAICSAVVFSLATAVFGDTFVYNNVTVSTGEVEPGVWNCDYYAVSNYVAETGNPMIVFWGNEGCGHCSASERSIGSDTALTAWLEENEIALAFAINGNGKFPTEATAAAKRFSKTGASYPFIRWYWKDDNGVVHDTASVNTIYSDRFFAITKQTFAGWTPPSSAGMVKLPNDPGNRLEFEDGMTNITIDVTRPEKKATEAVKGTFQAKGPDGNVFFSQELDWAAGETVKTVDIPLTDTGCTKTGDEILVGVLDDKGVLKRPGVITYVTGNSAANPLWIGERQVPSAAKARLSDPAPDYQFGEWTMDLDVATNTVAQTEGAFTVVSIQGSLWCPDCANTDRNFLELKDAEADTQTKFQKWAASNKVALVAIDIPNFTDTKGSYATPTLLSTNVFKSTLARESYTNKYGKAATPTKSTLNKSVFPKETPELTGADPALTEALPRSGLGYWTRKGITAEEAKAILDRNHDLVVNNTDKGGFHRPEDSNANRTGVPIFVVLRRDGTVAGRFTTFAKVSPFTKDRDSFDAYVKRIEELMKEAGQADNGEIANNDARTTTLTLKAAGETTPTGGNLAKCLSHADAIDVFKLEGVAKGVRQLVKISRPPAEAGDGKVSLTLQRLNGGKPETVTQRVGRKDVEVTASGLLSAGVALEYAFPDAGDYFVEVKADTTDRGFAVDSANSTWMAYSLETAMLIDPVESESTLTIDESYESVFVRIVKGEWYRIEGLRFTQDGDEERGLPGDGGVPGKLEGPYNIGGAHYYRALVSDSAVAPLDGSGSLSYQIWRPGEIGFGTPNTAGSALKQEAARTVRENAGEVQIPVSRVNGASSAAKVTVVLNLEKSVNIYAADDGHPRFVETPEALTNELVWADGESGVRYHKIEILDDARFDDACKFVFDIVMEPGDGFAEVKNGTFTLTVTENDRKSAGKASFTGVTGMYFAKPATVYAREDEAVTLELSRLVGSDAVVTGLVKTTLGAVSPASVEWGFHDDGVKAVTVSGIPAGKTARVSINKTFGGLGKGSPSSVSIVSIATNAPGFAARTFASSGYAYVAVSNLYPVVNVAAGGKLSFTKVSGALPSGLKATYDAAAQALCLVGVPTRAGTSTAVFQVVETVKSGRSTVKVPGMVTQITFTVADPSKAEPGLTPINASCATAARTLADIPMVAPTAKRLAGVLTLTIPKGTGRVSAKYNCAAGTVSFAAAKSWSTLATEADGQFVAELVPSNKKLAGYNLKVEAFPDKRVRATLTDPAFPGEDLVFEHMGLTWSDLTKTAAYATGAKDWAGYYTVALPMEEVVSEETAGYAADGTGYLTLKMSASAAKTGKMTWALMLPNGVTASGSSTLYPTGEDYGIPGGESLEIARLPISWTKGTERFSAVLKVLRGAEAQAETWAATVMADETAPACWRHTAAAKDAAAAIGFETLHGVYGGLYDAKADLGGCCQESYETDELGFCVSVTNLFSGKYGALVSEANPVARIKVSEAKLTVDQAWNPQRVTVSVTRGTGLVRGSLKLSYIDPAKGMKNLTVNFKGILLQGWGNGCGCGDAKIPSEMEQPFVSGSWFLSDKITYEKPGATRPSTVTDKRGGAFAICAESVK